MMKHKTRNKEDALNSLLTSLIMLLCLSTTTVWSADDGNNFVANAHLPSDAKATCDTDISSWFAGGEVTANGWVNPANSLAPVFADFDNNTKCDFYKWGAQMFLWLTSGNTSQHVFNTSPGFYNVSVEENNQRTFLESDGPMLLGVRKAKTDEQIELGQAGGFDVLLSQNESLVYYGLHANDVFALYTTGQKQGAFNSAQGWVSPQEDAACLAQYESCASEIAGYCKDQLANCTHNNFPSTQKQLDIVSDFATQYGYPLGGDKIALAIELKTSWIDASPLQNTGDYVLTQAVVPVFDRKAKDKTTGKQQWTITGTEEKTLAMVGMHVVGTVNGHPEMIWATFEHVDNVPDSAYVYTATTDKPATQAYNSTGPWNFMTSGAAEPTAITANAKVSAYEKSASYPDPECVKASPDDDNSECIVNIKGADIAKIDVLRVDPWGNDQTGNPSASQQNNTDLVSINVSVLSQLSAGDIRGNYIQTGSIWTAEGQIPPDGSDTDLRGSLKLANSTMETFFQFKRTDFNPLNCFGCHGSTPVEATEVSHIFDELQPLPKKAAAKP